ncbi:MAG: hypothetical protein AB8H47_01225, partial [Bacteroidia bacterium]
MKAFNSNLTGLAEQPAIALRFYEISNLNRFCGPDRGWRRGHKALMAEHRREQNFSFRINFWDENIPEQESIAAQTEPRLASPLPPEAEVLEEEVRKLEAELLKLIKQVQSENEVLKSAERGLKQQIKELNQALNLATLNPGQQSYLLLKGTLIELTTAKNLLEQQLNQTILAQRNTQIPGRNNEDELEKQKTELLRLEEENSRLTQLIRTNSNDLLVEYDLQETHVLQLQQVIARMGSQLEVGDENQVSQAEIDRYQTQISQLSQQLATANTDLANLSRSWRAMSANLTTANQERITLRESLQNLQTQQKVQTQQVNQRLEQQQDQRLKYQSLLTQNRAQQQEIQLLNGTIASLEGQLNAQPDPDEMKNYISQLQEENGILATKLQSTSQESITKSRRQSAQRDSLFAEVKKLQGLNYQQDQEILSMKGQLSASQQSASAATSQQQLQSRINELETQLLGQQNREQELTTSIKAKQTEITQLELQLNNIGKKDNANLAQQQLLENRIITLEGQLATESAKKSQDLIQFQNMQDQHKILQAQQKNTILTLTQERDALLAAANDEQENENSLAEQTLLQNQIEKLETQLAKQNTKNLLAQTEAQKLQEQQNNTILILTQERDALLAAANDEQENENSLAEQTLLQNQIEELETQLSNEKAQKLTLQTESKRLQKQQNNTILTLTQERDALLAEKQQLLTAVNSQEKNNSRMAEQTLLQKRIEELEAQLASESVANNQAETQFQILKNKQERLREEHNNSIQILTQERDSLVAEKQQLLASTHNQQLEIERLEQTLSLQKEQSSGEGPSQEQILQGQIDDLEGELKLELADKQDAEDLQKILQGR